MDFNERMEQMRQEYEQRRKEMEERMKQHSARLADSVEPYKRDDCRMPWAFDQRDAPKPAPGNPWHQGKKDPENYANSKTNEIELLEHLDGLQDESETKIGNFEKLIRNYILYLNAPTGGVSAYGYNDNDFASIVCLLGSVVEIEFSTLLAPYAESWELYASRNNNDNKGKDKNKNRDYLSLGSMSWVYKKENKGHYFFKNILLSAGVNFEDSKRQYYDIFKTRNGADHTHVISAEDFCTFYKETYHPFYHHTIRAVAAYNKQRIIASREQRLAADSSERQRIAERRAISFSLTDFQEQLDRLFEPLYPERRGGKCVILTNLERLSMKYYGAVNYLDENDRQQSFLPRILELIDQFICQAHESGIAYQLLDVSNPAYANTIDAEGSWESHLALLDSFFLQENLRGEASNNLFILGGDDVIPMPKVRNPLITPDMVARKLDSLETIVEADWLYCFPAKNIATTKDGYLDWDRLSGVQPRFYVSRLPMESGLMETAVEQDLGSYFLRANAERNGIDVNTLTVVAMEAAKKTANKMVENLPVSPIPKSSDDGLYYGKVFTSPKIAISGEDIPVGYREQLQQTDLLVFEMHGGADPNNPFYKGQASDNNTNPRHPVAFSPEFFAWVPAKVIAPMCCWGARFINYRREQSSLLSAIYSSGLIFFGSCRSSWGCVDLAKNDEPEWNNQATVIKLAQTLLRLFLQFLLSGCPAGEALSKAKCVYMNEIIEEDMHRPHQLLTLLEFNLFGDPMLRLKPAISLADQPDHSNSRINIELPNFTPGSYSTQVTVLADYDDRSLLNRVRNLVDSNLNDIRNRLNALLLERYQIDPTTLRRIEKWATFSNKENYCFYYKEREGIEQSTCVFTDQNGAITQVFGTI